MSPAPALGQAEFNQIQNGRFTVTSFARDATLARAILSAAVAADTFPGLPRPREPLVIQVAPDVETFR
ncbi:MAG: hypothetical protein ACLGIK_08175, partial [Gemmatimonadota bacterium]